MAEGAAGVGKGTGVGRRIGVCCRAFRCLLRTGIFQGEDDPLCRAKTRRYSIDIKDPNNKSVLFTAVDWTDEERLVAVAQILRLAGLPEDNGFAAPAAKPENGGGKT